MHAYLQHEHVGKNLYSRNIFMHSIIMDRMWNRATYSYRLLMYISLNKNTHSRVLYKYTHGIEQGVKTTQIYVYMCVDTPHLTFTKTIKLFTIHKCMHACMRADYTRTHAHTHTHTHTRMHTHTKCVCTLLFCWESSVESLRCFLAAVWSLLCKMKIRQTRDY